MFFQKWQPRFESIGRSLFRHRRIALCSLIVLFALFLRFERYAGRELWCDELSQTRNVNGVLQPFWQRLSYGEVTCFPGEYLLTYPFVNLAHGNKWIMTFPHILATVFSFLVLYWLCQAYFKTTWGYVIAFAAVALNRNLIFHAFENRPYAVLAMLGMLIFYSMGRLLAPNSQMSPWKKIGLSGLMVLTVAYHAYGALIVFFSFVFHALDQRKLLVLKENWKYIVAAGSVAVPIFFWYQTGYPLSGQALGMNVFDYIPNPLVSFSGFLKAINGNLLGYKQYGFILLHCGIIVSILLSSNRDRSRQLMFLFVMIVLPIQSQMLADLHTGYWFLPRQFSWVMPLYAFLIAWSWDSIAVAFREKRGTIIFCQRKN